MVRPRCSTCGALIRGGVHSLKRVASFSDRSLDKQQVPIVPYRESWRDRWRHEILGKP